VPDTPTIGSQELLRRAVNKRPELLRNALVRSEAVRPDEALRWVSPLHTEEYCEYRDSDVLSKLELIDRIRCPLSDFWPPRGPVWDGLAITSKRRPILVESKAHIPEAIGGGARAGENSLELIQKSLEECRRHLAPRSSASWTGAYYQYANRLAYQFYLRERNHIANSTLVFLCFTNAADMDGAASEEQWRGAIRLIHAALGLSEDLAGFGVCHAFLNAEHLMDA
jgi:hypothetical protein